MIRPIFCALRYDRVEYSLQQFGKKRRESTHMPKVMGPSLKKQALSFDILEEHVLRYW